MLHGKIVWREPLLQLQNVKREQLRTPAAGRSETCRRRDKLSHSLPFDMSDHFTSGCRDTPPPAACNQPADLGAHTYPPPVMSSRGMTCPVAVSGVVSGTISSAVARAVSDAISALLRALVLSDAVLALSLASFRLGYRTPFERHLDAVPSAFRALFRSHSGR